MPNSLLKGRQEHWKTTTTTRRKKTNPDTLIKKLKKESTHNPHTSVTTKTPYQTPGNFSQYFSWMIYMDKKTGYYGRSTCT